MAFIIENKSKCPICGKLIKEINNIVMFPSFVHNIKDPFYVFNDAGVHLECLEKHKFSSKALEYLDILVFKTRPENRICDIEGNPILNSDDYLFIDLLTSDSNEELSKFNFMTIDKRNITRWSEAKKFLSLADKFLSEQKWESFDNFNYLKYLMNEIESRLS